MARVEDGVLVTQRQHPRPPLFAEERSPAPVGREEASFRWLCELIRNGLLVAVRGEQNPTTRRGFLIIVRGIEARYGLKRAETGILDE